MKQLKKAAVLLIALMLVLCSCSAQKQEKKPSEKPSVPTTNEQTGVEKDSPNKDDSSINNEHINENEPEEHFEYVNPLTGMGCHEDLSNVRPIAVMVNNLKAALPQIGVSQADVIYETLEEGGITRLLCIFNDYSDIEELGSIRSARDYYIDISDAHDAIFVHAGGSVYAYSDLSSRRTNNIDGLYVSQFYRSQERKKTMATEHTLMISGSGLEQAIADKGYRTASDNPSPLVFSENYTKGTTVANHIEFPFSIGYTSNPYVKAFFDYDENTGTYLKGQFDQPHIDGNGNIQLAFKNVITLTCPMNRIVGDTSGCIQVHFTGTGIGTYSVDGTQREIVWKKPSRSSAYTLYESDGVTPLVIAPGKSYIAVVPTGTNITTN
ncbi:MAG: DUF3048 domain-containing protein [Ruminococcaceae bacterium]|nr:DUF3048 domain-containing protein [Oscillospiraceae bacterium]